MENITANSSPIIIFLAFGLYGVVHSIFAAKRVKDLVYTLGGAAAQRGYRLAYNIVATLTLLPIFAMLVVLPDKPLYSLPFIWKWLALAGQLVAVVGMLAALFQTGLLDFLGIGQLTGGESQPGAKMTTGGLYRWVRHPLYTAGLVFMWLTPEMSQNLLALYLSLSAYIYFGAIVEERKLVDEFGQQYVDFQASTPMLLPRPPRK
ncbi:MAG: isoprenylcysteine carboxylmethyltransferase family protein [Anaerolineae bacterium]|nr:isoprenylcysteine carboxylmethyltransferase family protein [Anaerolineae bacterium]